MRKNKKVAVTTITAKDRFDREKPRYNAYQCGTGVWKNKKHPDRAARKQMLRKEIG